MKTHELKLDIKYFDDVKSGKKKFEIRKNDRDFEVGDILELKAYAGRESAEEQSIDVDYAWTQYLPEEGYDVWENCEEELADTIKAKITMIIGTEELNMALDFWDRLKKDFLCTNVKYPNAKPFMASEVRKVLNDYFSTDRLPDEHVVLGIEVVE